MKKNLDDMYLDIGVYGVCEKENYDKIEFLKKMERFTIDHNGYQVRLEKALLHTMFS